MKQTFLVTGMTCSACSAHVEKSVNKLDAVEKANVNLLAERMQVIYDEERITEKEIIEAVEKAGYGASVANDNHVDNHQEVRNQGKKNQVDSESVDDNRQMRNRLLISFVFLLPLMYISMFHMYNEWFGLPIPGFIMKLFHGEENAVVYALTQLMLLVPILYVNRFFFIRGYRTLFHLSPSMDSLVALGSTAAVVYGVFALYRIGYGLGHGDMQLVTRYSHELYFESAGMILTLITLGKYLESRSRKRTGEAIRSLMNLSPQTAVLLLEDGTEKEVSTKEVNVGDIFLVKPGSLIPVDGEVLEGNSGVDEAAITGESIPVEKKQGDGVISATLNKSGFLKCRALRVGEDTTLAQIIRLVEEASAGKAPIAKLADRISGIFVPVVIMIAMITLVGWLIAGADMEFAISVAIAVLVISCPCALGLATPVAIMVGTGVGAKNGILIKSGDALQNAGRVDTIVLDKTGTITAGQLQVMQIKSYDSARTGQWVLQYGAALEKNSEHPLAEAIVKKADAEKIQIPKVQSFIAVPGKGVEGTIEGRRFFLGNERYLSEQGIQTSIAKMDSEEMAEKGFTPLFLAEEKMLSGVISVADEIRDSSFIAIREWQKMGFHTVMLTGDNQKTAEAVRERVGIEAIKAEVLPQDKEKYIRDLKDKGHITAMIGDGINDAPALTQADVGIAIGAGTDVAIESADIVLMKSDLRDAVTAIRLSRSVIRNIKENLFWAFFYNSIGIPLAAGLLYPAFGIRLNPMIGAAAMSLSSICVVANALRLKGFKSRFSGKSTENADRDVFGENNNLILNKNILKEEENMDMEGTNKERILHIEGMSCNHCTKRVQDALMEVAGVESVEMSLEKKCARVMVQAEISDDMLKQIVTDAGYEVVSVE